MSALKKFLAPQIALKNAGLPVPTKAFTFMGKSPRVAYVLFPIT